MLGERFESSDFFRSLVLAPAGISFGQTVNGDVDGVQKELRKIIAKKVNKTSVNVAVEGNRDTSPRNCHQVLESALYSETLYGLFDCGAIPNVISRNLAN